VSVGRGVSLGSDVAVGSGFLVACGVGVAVGVGVSVGVRVGVRLGVQVEVAVGVGVGVLVAVGVGVGVSVRVGVGVVVGVGAAVVRVPATAWAWATRVAIASAVGADGPPHATSESTTRANTRWRAIVNVSFPAFLRGSSLLKYLLHRTPDVAATHRPTLSTMVIQGSGLVDGAFAAAAHVTVSVDAPGAECAVSLVPSSTSWWLGRSCPGC